MNRQELLHKIILDEITLSQGLMLCRVMYKDAIPEESFRWICSELDHYEDIESIPDYRVLDCSLVACVRGHLGERRDEVLDTTAINRQLIGSDKPYASPNKMLVTQGIESIEQTLKNAGPMVRMALHQGQIDLLLNYYSCSPGYRFESFYQECRKEQLRNIIPSVRQRLVGILENIDTIHEEKRGSNLKRKTVFISYGWDNEEHCAWVRKLAERLDESFEVKIDNQLSYGSDLNAFMEKMISSSDRVLLILTPRYKEKADARETGVGYETVLISSELYRNQGSNKFIPIIRKGDINESYPLYLGARKGLDMRNDDKYEEKLAELIEDIINN